MTDAIIIAYRNPLHPALFVLVATRPSRSLRDGLKHFAEQIYNEFRGDLETPSKVSQFRAAEGLITACFPHVPVYD